MGKSATRTESRGNSRVAGVAAVALGVALALALAPAAGGCGAKVEKGRGAPMVRPAPRAPGASAAPKAPSAAAPQQQDCAGRLHDLSGLLLHYYALNQKLPDRLDELAAMAESESEYRPACPASGRPYVYVPGGLGAPGTDQRLLIYDPTPAHGGLRLVVVASPGQGNQPPNTRVIPFSEERLRAYVGDAGNAE